MPNFVINRNGNDANDIRDQFIKLNQLLEEVEKHVSSMDYTHGRNYQTLDNAAEAQHEDVQERFRQARALRDMKKFAMSGAARAISQREGL